MIRIIAALAVLAALTGCASIGQAGAAASDEARDTAEFVLCKGITVGSWLRAYGGDPKRAEAWRALCSTSVSEAPAK